MYSRTLSSSRVMRWGCTNVARVKMASLPEGEKPVFYRPEREAWVLKHIMELNKAYWVAEYCTLVKPDK